MKPVFTNSIYSTMTPQKWDFCLNFKTQQNTFTNPVYETAIQNETRNVRLTHLYVLHIRTRN